MLNYIIYYSFSSSDISSNELEEILRKAREWNQAHEITGLLIYRFNKIFKRGWRGALLNKKIVKKLN